MVDMVKLLVEYDSHLVVGRRNWWSHAVYMQFGAVEVEEAVTSLCRIADLVILHENGAGIQTTELVKVHETRTHDSWAELGKGLDLLHIHCALAGQEMALGNHIHGALGAQEKGLDNCTHSP